MMRLLALLLGFGLLGGTARADDLYVSEALGGTSVSDQLGASMSGAMRIRVAAGLRRGTWAVEGWVASDFMLFGGAEAAPAGCGCAAHVSTPPTSPGSAWPALLSYGVDAKYLHGLSRHVDAYLRGGASRGLLAGDYAGNGLGVGAGLQVRGKIPVLALLFWPLAFTDWGPKMNAAAFVDDGVDFYRLHADDGSHSLDARLSHLTVGFGFGTDF